MTPKAKKFLAENAKSPVISGYAIEPNPTKPAKGVSYTLEDGQTFLLTPKECADVGMPKWKGMGQ